MFLEYNYHILHVFSQGFTESIVNSDIFKDETEKINTIPTM